MEGQKAKERRSVEGANGRPNRDLASNPGKQVGQAPSQQKQGPKEPGKGSGSGGKPGPSGPVWPILRRLLGYMRPHAAILTGVILAALATTVVELAPPWIIRLAVDRFILEGRTAEIWWAAGGLLALSLVQGGVDFLRLYLTAYTSQRIVFEIRNAIFHHLSRLSFSFYDRARTGDLMSRVTADVDVLNNFFGRAAVIILSNFMIHIQHNIKESCDS